MYRLIILLGLCWAFTGCREVALSPAPYPSVSEVDIIPQNNGVLFRASIERNTSEPITDHGFLISSSNIPTLEAAEITLSLGTATEQPASFEEKLESSLDNETQYFVRAFLKTEDFTVYGLINSFSDFTTTLTPQITGYEPTVGMRRDTLFFSGRNFPINQSKFSVKIGGFFAPVVQAQPNGFGVIIPAVATNEWHEIDLQINSVQYPIETPVEVVDFTAGFTPRQATFLDTIRIRGVFPNVMSSSIPYQVFMDGAASEVVDFQRNVISALVPVGVSTAAPSITVTVPDSIPGSFVARGPLQLISPEISYFDGAAMKRGETFTIHGNYFNPAPEGNRVFVNDQELRVDDATAEQITVSWSGVPVPDNDFFLITEVAGLRDSVLSVGPIPEPETWQEWISFPISGFDRYIIYETGKGIYAGFGEKNGGSLDEMLFRYELGTGEWTNVPVEGILVDIFTHKFVWQEDDRIYVSGKVGGVIINQFNPFNELFQRRIYRNFVSSNRLVDAGYSSLYAQNKSFLLYDLGLLFEYDSTIEGQLSLRVLEQFFNPVNRRILVRPIGIWAGSRHYYQLRMEKERPEDEPQVYLYELSDKNLEEGVIEWTSKGAIGEGEFTVSETHLEFATEIWSDESGEEIYFLLGPSEEADETQLLYGNESRGFKTAILPEKIFAKNMLVRPDGSLWVPGNGKIWRFQFK